MVFNLEKIYAFALISEYVFGASFMDATGTTFEDNFKRFQPTKWKTDTGTKHCGSSSIGGCIWTSRDNVRYISDSFAKDRPWESNEMMISMRNDCDEEYCCQENAGRSSYCTEYTSGQVTSTDSYGYGSFYFMAKIGTQVSEGEQSTPPPRRSKRKRTPQSWSGTVPDVVTGNDENKAPSKMPSSYFDHDIDVMEFWANVDEILIGDVLFCDELSAAIPALCASSEITSHGSIGVRLQGSPSDIRLTKQWVKSNGGLTLPSFGTLSAKPYKIEATSYKSVRCTHPPSMRKFPSALRAIPKAGYCENHNADLENMSSNRDLCDGVVENICGRYTWVIQNYADSTFSFNAKGKKIDYENSAIYVDGEFAAGGGREAIQDFSISLLTKGKHKIQIYGFEDCCAGGRSSGYFGWSVDRTAFVTAAVNGWSGSTPSTPGGYSAGPSSNGGSTIPSNGGSAMSNHPAWIHGSPSSLVGRLITTPTIRTTLNVTTQGPCSGPGCSQNPSSDEWTTSDDSDMEDDCPEMEEIYSRCASSVGSSSSHSSVGHVVCPPECARYAAQAITILDCAACARFLIEYENCETRNILILE